MMSSPPLVSFVSGLVSALLFLSGTTGTALGAVLVTMSPLPLFISGLGFGTRGAVISASIGTIIAGLATAGVGPLFYAVFAAFPAVLLTYLALLRRASAPIAGGGGFPAPQQVEWFPAGQLVLAAAFAGALGVAALLIIVFGTSAQYQEAIRTTLGAVFESLAKPLTEGMTPEEVANLRTNFIDQTLSILPAVFGVSAMLVPLANLWLAGLVARRSGLLDRPWLPIHVLDYPKWAAAALVLAFLASRAGGTLAWAGTALTGTLVFAYFILGAAALLALTAGTAMRPLAIIAVILSVVLEPFAIFLAIFGLAENFMQLRARKAAQAGSPPKQ